MKEVWKDIPGCEGRYQISNFGRAKGPLKILKPSISDWGYQRLRVTDNNSKKRSPRVHRLVAPAFIPNPNGLPEVNHIDGNKLNNRVDNLEWVSAKENKEHSIRELGVSPWGRKPSSIYCKETGERYHSVAYASKQTGISSTQLFEHLKGRRSHAGNLHWAYVEK